MNVPKLIKTFGKSVDTNSPAILAGVAVTGVLSTGYLAARGAVQATRRLDMECAMQQAEVGGETPNMPLMEQAKIVWPYYVPAAAVGATTIIAILSGHNINAKRNAAIMGLYSVTDKAFTDYQAKVTEMVGEDSEGVIRDNVAKARMSDGPVSNNEVIITGSGEQLCYETFTSRYFRSDIEKIRKSVNDINEQIFNDNYASLNDFYRLVGMKTTTLGDDIGWTTDNMMTVHYTSDLTDDGKPCLAITYRAEPIRDYYRNF